MKKLSILILINIIFAQTSEKANVTIYKDGTALVKQEIIWDNIPKGKSIIKYDDIPKSIQKDTPFISIENVQVLNQKFVEKIFSSNNYFSSKKGDYITVKLKNEKAVSGNLLEISSSVLTIQSKYSVRSFNRDNIEYIETKDNISALMLSFVSIYSILSLLKLLTLYLDWMVNTLLEISKRLPLTAFSFFSFTVI